MNAYDMFLLLSDAQKELALRWNDVILRKKVEDYLGPDFNHLFNDEPRCLYFRVILTPNFETRYFNDLVSLTNIKPLCLEFHLDKFCSLNKDKVHLGKMVFAHENTKTKQIIRSKKVIIDFHESEQKNFGNIVTKSQENFMDLHHRLYMREYGNLMDIFDVSAMKEKGYTMKEIYKKIFAFCIAKGILFENFITKEAEGEKKFVEKVVIPAYEEVLEFFKHRPLVVPLLPFKNEEKEHWIWYPTNLASEIETII